MAGGEGQGIIDNMWDGRAHLSG